MMLASAAVNRGADEPRRSALVNAALRGVALDSGHESNQLPQHPTAMGIEAAALVKALEIGIELRIMPPAHLRPCKSIIRENPDCDRSQQRNACPDVQRSLSPYQTGDSVHQCACTICTLLSRSHDGD